MRKIMEALHELQEMEIVLRESDILHDGQVPDAAEKTIRKIAVLRKTVPEDILRRFDALRRNGTAVATETGGVCSACRLNIPIGDLNRMRKGLIPWVCPNCGRYLLLSKE